MLDFVRCVIYIHSKYTWVVPLIDKKDIKITNEYVKVFDNNRKPNKARVDQGSTLTINQWY